MMERITISEFLEDNPGFIFNLVEYVASTQFIERAQKRFDIFCQSFLAETSQTITPWQKQRDAIREAVSDIPAYDCIDWSRPDYWKTIPCIDKNSLRAHPDAFLSPRYNRKDLWQRPTSGTTGPPVTIWYSPEYFVEFRYFMAWKVVWLAGALNDDVRHRPIFCAAIVDNKYLADRVWACPDDSQGLTVQITFDERSPASMARLAELLHRFRPAIMTLKPNILNSLLLTPNASLKDAASHLQMIISGGADLNEEVRRKGEQLLGIPIYNAYGMTEVGGIAAECSLQDHIHIMEADIIPEILDATGTIQETGTGELVVSNIANIAMPMLRYRTGDLVELTSEPCGCGKAGRRIRNLSGRQIRNFRLRDGSEFAPTNFQPLFGSFPIKEFRLTQTAPEKIEAEIEVLPSCTDTPGVLRSIHEHITRELRYLADVDISETVFIPGDKFQRYRTLI